MAVLGSVLYVLFLKSTILNHIKVKFFKNGEKPPWQTSIGTTYQKSFEIHYEMAEMWLATHLNSPETPFVVSVSLSLASHISAVGRPISDIFGYVM